MSQAKRSQVAAISIRSRNPHHRCRNSRNPHSAESSTRQRVPVRFRVRVEAVPRLIAARILGRPDKLVVLIGNWDGEFEAIGGFEGLAVRVSVTERHIVVDFLRELNRILKPVMAHVEHTVKTVLIEYLVLLHVIFSCHSLTHW